MLAECRPKWPGGGGCDGSASCRVANIKLCQRRLGLIWKGLPHTDSVGKGKQSSTSSNSENTMVFAVPHEDGAA